MATCILRIDNHPDAVLSGDDLDVMPKQGRRGAKIRKICKYYRLCGAAGRSSSWQSIWKSKNISDGAPFG
jgi:hypothetical protein